MMITISGSSAHTADSFSTITESQTHPTILLVNLDADLLGTVRDQLTVQGFEVSVARDGITALEALRRAVPDAIVVDIDSLGSTGVSLAEELKDWGLPIVLTTSRRDRPVIPGAEYLDKPYDSSELVEILSWVIEPDKDRAERPAIRRHVLSE
jgi:DNA-binding response OmpR family regulator